jgi:soluble lytic murein transglycosylase-like protein
MERSGIRVNPRALVSFALAGLWLAIALGAATVTRGPSPRPAVERPAVDLPYGDMEGFEARDFAAEETAERAEDLVAAEAEETAERAEDLVAVEAEEAADRVEDLVAATQREHAAEEDAPGEPASGGTAQAEAAAQSLGPEPRAEPDAGVLSAADVARYRRIFRAQQRGRWQTADSLIAALEDETLLGHVLAERYLHPDYVSRYAELRRWLTRYADHPVADKIYKLALKKRPRGGILPQPPVVRDGTLAKLGPITSPPYRSKKRLTRAQRTRVRQLEGRIRRQVGRRQLTATEKLIGGAEVQRLFDQVQVDRATASVAAGWFYYGNYDKAMRLADEAARRSGQEAPLALWTAGLASWRLADFAAAALHFEAYARAPEASDWTAAAGAYWAARCHEQLGRRDKAEAMLRLAAESPLTFYGLLARHRLGLPHALDFRPRPFDGARAAPLLATKAGRRALALLQLGDDRRLEQELMDLEGWEQPATGAAVLAVAEAAELPALSLRLARRLVADGADGWTARRLARALYPLPPWAPRDGFTLDRALIYAVMRQESHFKRYARSPSGARGLMQLLPSTARSLIKGQDFRGRERARLYEPALNMELGQRYLARLLEMSSVGGDLFRLATAYNGGPGNLRSWTRISKAEDPLLFIESLPIRESRMYVEHVLTNLWIYRARLGQPAPSLADVAANRWPAYAALDGKVFEAVRWTAEAKDDGAPPEDPWWRFW